MYLLFWKIISLIFCLFCWLVFVKFDLYFDELVLLLLSLLLVSFFIFLCVNVVGLGNVGGGIGCGGVCCNGFVDD